MARILSATTQSAHPGYYFKCPPGPWSSRAGWLRLMNPVHRGIYRFSAARSASRAPEATGRPHRAPPTPQTAAVPTSLPLNVGVLYTPKPPGHLAALSQGAGNSAADPRGAIAIQENTKGRGGGEIRHPCPYGSVEVWLYLPSAFMAFCSRVGALCSINCAVCSSCCRFFCSRAITSCWPISWAPVISPR